MSMIGIGRSHLQGALRSGLKATQLENERNMANEQLDQAEKQQTTMSTMTGAGLGMAAAGALSMSVPVAGIAGAALGYILGELF